MPTIRLLIKGKVQGVFYRASAKDAAEQIGITGWVKNTEQGYVESVATGSDEQLQRFISWCKAGPPQAIVSVVDIKEIEEQIFEKFKIVRD